MNDFGYTGVLKTKYQSDYTHENHSVTALIQNTQQQTKENKTAILFLL